MRKQETSSAEQSRWQFALLRGRKKQGYKYCHSDSFTQFCYQAEVKQIRDAFVKELTKTMPGRLTRISHTISTKCRKRNCFWFGDLNK